MNAQTEKDGNKFSFQNSLNKNGKYQPYFSLENGLANLNTKFKRRIKYYGFMPPPPKFKAWLDFIFMNKNEVDKERFSL